MEEGCNKKGNLSTFLIKWGIALVILCIGVWWTEGADIGQKKYHQQYAQSIELIDGNLIGIEGLEERLVGKEIIFTAESHGVAMNMPLELAFIKYFKEKTNFKYYLCELSHAQAMMFNKYLKTGDRSILDELYSHYEGTFAYTEDTYNRWVWLYEFNQTLPEVDRIEVVGVDVEHQVAYAAKVLRELMPEQTAPEEIKEMVQLVKGGDLKQLDTIQKVYDDVMAKSSMYDAYIGESYFDFEIILKNMVNLYEVNKDDRYFDRERDRCMYENFMAIYPRLPKDVFYGQWGLNHAFKHDQNGIKWIASAMEEGDFKDKVLSIAYGYNDCSYMSRNKDRTYGESPLSNIEPRTMGGLPESDLVLIPLKEKGSPYGEKLLWPYKKEYNYPVTSGVTTDYFDYLLVIQNSGATKPLK